LPAVSSLLRYTVRVLSSLAGHLPNQPGLIEPQVEGGRGKFFLNVLTSLILSLLATTHLSALRQLSKIFF
jgi:hypothetical protein